MFLSENKQFLNINISHGSEVTHLSDLIANLPLSLTHSVVVVALGYGCSRKFGVPFNISVIAEDSNFKLGRQFGFANSTYKITPEDKSGVNLN